MAPTSLITGITKQVVSSYRDTLSWLTTGEYVGFRKIRGFQSRSQVFSHSGSGPVSKGRLVNDVAKTGGGPVMFRSIYRMPGLAAIDKTRQDMIFYI